MTQEEFKALLSLWWNTELRTFPEVLTDRLLVEAKSQGYRTLTDAALGLGVRG